MPSLGLLFLTSARARRFPSEVSTDNWIRVAKETRKPAQPRRRTGELLRRHLPGPTVKRTGAHCRDSTDLIYFCSCSAIAWPCCWGFRPLNRFASRSTYTSPCFVAWPGAQPCGARRAERFRAQQRAGPRMAAGSVNTRSGFLHSRAADPPGSRTRKPDGTSRGKRTAFSRARSADKTVTTSPKSGLWVSLRLRPRSIAFWKSGTER